LLLLLLLLLAPAVSWPAPPFLARFAYDMFWVEIVAHV